MIAIDSERSQNKHKRMKWTPIIFKTRNKYINEVSGVSIKNFTDFVECYFRE